MTMRMVQKRIARYGWITKIATSFCVIASLAGQQVAIAQDAMPLGLPTAPPAAATAPSLGPGPLPAAAANGAVPNPATATQSAPRTEIVTENGVQYRVTTATVRQPVVDVRYEDRQQTGYQQRLRTDLQRVNYYTQVPVTQYECVPRLYDWWRVFRGGYVASGLEPYTTYQTQPQTTTVPVVSREVRPVTQTVKVAVPNNRFVERQVVISRERINDIGSAPPTLPPAPAYIPPRQVAPQFQQVAPQFQPPTGPLVPQYIPPAGVFSGASLAPRDPGALGGWSVATPVSNGNTTGQGGLSPSYVPPTSAASAAADESRYGGVARFDGDPPRYGSGSIGQR